MIIDYEPSQSEAFYHVMIQAIVPRPIAWVLSRNPNGSFNVAPFSFFSGVASEPPIIMLSVGWKDDVTRKDTWVNIDERKDFVVHIPSAEMGENVVATSAALPFNESELDQAKLLTVPVEGMSLPRLAGPKVAMFCEKHKIIEVGEEKQGMILGEIKKIWLDENVTATQKDRLLIDPKKLNPLSRLGGKDYSTLGPIFPINRPKS